MKLTAEQHGQRSAAPEGSTPGGAPLLVPTRLRQGVIHVAALPLLGVAWLKAKRGEGWVKGAAQSLGGARHAGGQLSAGQDAPAAWSPRQQ